MKQIKYTLLVWLAALMLFPAGVGATDAEVLQKDLKIQDVFQRYGRKKNVTWWNFPTKCSRRTV